jgi:hypothetical protein
MNDQISEADIAELEAACFELARSAKWVQKPIDSDEIRDLAARFVEIAKSRIFVSDDLRIDAPLIARAARYLTQAHGMPTGDDTQWFGSMLTAVLEVARPNSGLDEEGQAFLKDMREGIDSILDDG